MALPLPPSMQPAASPRVDPPPAEPARPGIFVGLPAAEPAQAAAPVEVVDGRIYLDSGPSTCGWSSRWGLAFACRQLFAWVKVLGLVEIEGEALVRGSLGHVGLAHGFKAMQLRQAEGRGLPLPQHPDVVPWDEAMERWAKDPARSDYEAELAGSLLPKMLDVVRWYWRTYPDPPGKILAVEEEIVGVLGNRQRHGHAPEWGLWPIQAPGLTSPGLTSPGIRDGRPAEDGRPADLAVLPPVAVVPLACPQATTRLSSDSPVHGSPVIISRRLDLVLQSHRGVEVWDHKFKGRVYAGVEKEYQMDGQWAAARWLARGIYGDRVVARLNAVQAEGDRKAILVDVPVTPHRDAGFPLDLYRMEVELAALEALGPEQAWWWPKAQDEQACKGRYGYCDGVNLCALGPGAGKPPAFRHRGRA